MSLCCLPQVGRYRYRLAAWNAYGWSPYAIVSDCATDNASLPCRACDKLGTCQSQQAPAALGAVRMLLVQAIGPRPWLMLSLWSAAVGLLVLAAVLMLLPQSRNRVLFGAKQVGSHLPWGRTCWAVKGCVACSVRLPGIHVHRWGGGEMHPSL